MTTTEIPSRPLSTAPLITQIDAILNKDGQVSQSLKDNLMFSVIKTLLIQQEEMLTRLDNLASEKSALVKRVEVLEGRNIVTWSLNHPALTTLVVVLLSFLLFSHYGAAILNFFHIVIP